MPTHSTRHDASGRPSARRRIHPRKPGLRQLLVEPLEQRRLLAAQPLLFGGVDDAAVSPTNAGLMLAVDLDARLQMPLHAQLPFTGEGISGLAFASSGQLFGTTSEAAGSTSALIRIDPLTGMETSRVPITAGGPISIGDLAIQPDSNVLYAVRSADDGGGGAGEIYTIDTNSGAATFVGRPNAGGTVDGGLAFAPDGTLYYTTISTTTPVLHTLNPDNGAVLSTVSLTGSKGANSGLAYWADASTLVGSGAANGDIVRIDPTTGVRTTISLDAPARGVLGDLAFQPTSPDVLLVHHADFEGGNDGYTANNTGGTFPGLWHYSLGRRDDGLLNHSTTHAWYYGRFEGPRGEGRYDVFPGDHQGVLSSPVIQLPGGGASILSFSYVLNTRLPLNVDFVDVLIDNGDGDPVVVRSRQDGTLLQTSREMWLTATVDISAFNGQEVRVLFRFNTGAVPLVDPEGWYVDDVQISNFEELATIGGTKFEDVNGNGQRDEGEQGLAGWTLFADLNDNGELDGDEPSANTDDNGNYALGVGAGVYRIREVMQAGWLQTTANPPDITIAGGQEVLDVNFGNFELAAIGGAKFDDLNGNGVRDEGDPGLPGWTIFDDLNENGTLDGDEPSATTDDDGNYTLLVGPGTHRIREVLQDGWIQITTNPPDMTVTSGQQLPNVDFGNFALVDISGTKFDDLNGNGMRDGGEPGLPGWTIFVDENGNGTLDGEEPSTTTDDGGNYVLTVGPGTHRIREVLQTGWIQVTANPPDVTVTSGQNVLDVDFGNFELVEFSGAKFNDVNSNGTRDGEEPGLSGWTIFDDLNDNGILDNNEPSTVTDQQGNYTLIVGPGTHRIREVLQTGWIQVTENPAAVTVTSGQAFSNVGFGNFELVEFSGAKFNDINSNGTRDGGEPGLPGWTIFDDLNDNGILDNNEPSTVTDQQGNYTLIVGPGTHRIREVLQTGWIQVTENPAAVTVTSGQTFSNVDFGNAQLASIGGQVWFDVNGNTIIDASLSGGDAEAGIPNVTIRLLAADMTVIDTTVTSSSVMDVNGDGIADPIGSYFFGELAPGNYLIDVVDTTVPGGFGLTTGFDPLPAMLNPSQQILANFGYQSAIQFGTALGFFRADVPAEFAFVPFVRPADQPLLNLLEDPNRAVSDYLAYLTSTVTNPQSYQVFEIANTANTTLTVTSIDVLLASPGSAEFVKIYTEQQLQQLVELEAALASPITNEQIAQLQALLAGVTDASEIGPIAPGESATLFAFYQPVTRNPNGTVDTQFPEWYNDPQQPGNQTLQQQGAAHTFARNDHLKLTTELEGNGAGPTFQYQLVGGSTYDSDIGNYDGIATLLDFGVLDDILLQSSPTLPGQPQWDPTTDVNVRFPNGSDDLTGPLWPLTDPKEIGLGDFGPLNIELVRKSRAPFLDLDGNNDSMAAGVDFATRYSGQPVHVADADARFGNDSLLNLAGLEVIILMPRDGANEQLAVDTSGTTIVVQSNGIQNGNWVLSLSGSATVEAYLGVLSTITYTNTSATPTLGVRVIEVSALGSSDFVYEQGGQTLDQRMGNVALSKVTVEPQPIASPAAAALATSDEETIPFQAAIATAAGSATTETVASVSPPSETGNQPAEPAAAALTTVKAPSPVASAGIVANHPAQPNPVAAPIGSTLASNANQEDADAGRPAAASKQLATPATPELPPSNDVAPQILSAHVAAAWLSWSEAADTAADSTWTSDATIPVAPFAASDDRGVSSTATARQLASAAVTSLVDDGDSLGQRDAIFAEFGGEDQEVELLP